MSGTADSDGLLRVVQGAPGDILLLGDCDGCVLGVV